MFLPLAAGLALAGLFSFHGIEYEGQDANPEKQRSVTGNIEPDEITTVSAVHPSLPQSLCKSQAGHQPDQCPAEAAQYRWHHQPHEQRRRDRALGNLQEKSGEERSNPAVLEATK